MIGVIRSLLFLSRFSTVFWVPPRINMEDGTCFEEEYYRRKLMGVMAPLSFHG